MHKHHIIPRYMGGTDDPDNIIELTVEEHAEAHRVLYEQYNKREDRLAWLCLSGQISKEDIIRERARIARLGKPIDKTHAEKLHNGRRGRKNTERHRLAIIKSNSSRIISQETKEKISNSLKGRKHNDETRRKMSKSSIGKPKSLEMREKLKGNQNARRKP